MQQGATDKAWPENPAQARRWIFDPVNPSKASYYRQSNSCTMRKGYEE